ncbi:MAG: type VI secretion system protein TssA [Gammaproteobacteria bacterium]|nr:type VI secretion system protein TssA [Gammaproteobacteria bacterium]
MSVVIEKLLADISPDLPCGPNLEYDAEFVALEQAARSKPEQQLGETVVPAQVPDWSDVGQRAQTLLQRTKDIRVAVLYARARTCTENCVGLAAGLALIQQLLLRYWETVHPALEADDGNDPTMRVNALAPLADAETFLLDVRNAFLVEPAAYGKVSVRDILILLGKLAANDTAPSQIEIEGIIRTAGANNAVPTDAVHAALKTAMELQALLATKIGSPDLKPLVDTLRPVAQMCDTLLGTATDTTPVGSDAPTARSINGEILNREDAARLLDRVCEFFRRTEPCNPAPLFIRRAQQLMTKSFIEIIQDLAPDSLTQIQKLTGDGNNR